MKAFITLFIFLLLSAPAVIFAQLTCAPNTLCYEPLVGIPGFTPTGGIVGLINSLYALSISLAALLAVIKIIIAGVKWMMTDVVTSKGEARKDIEGALLGLIVIIAAFIILNQINPQLTALSITP